MNRNKTLYRMVAAALLCAVGIVIPVASPLKIVIPPASFTLASHVAIFIAMFISPVTAIVVSMGTTLGFFLGGFPLPIVLRALSHVVFAAAGAVWLKARPDLLNHRGESILFCAFIGLLHAAGEVLILLPLYFGGTLAAAVYESGFIKYIILLVGVGTVVHSSVDYFISVLIWRALRRAPGLREIAAVH